MTTTTPTPGRYVPAGSFTSPTRPSLTRLSRMEIRKMTDTRAGVSLLALTAAATLAIGVLQVLNPAGGLKDDVSSLMLPASVMLPVLGILAVTSEWSQHTALSTFTLVPQRHRVAIAKLAAAIAVALASVLTVLVLSVIVTLLAAALDRGPATWNLSAPALTEMTLIQIGEVVLGAAFGLVLMNTPAAIVLHFVLPSSIGLLSNVPAITPVIPWLDWGTATLDLSDGTLHGYAWAKVATASVVWIGIPLALGLFRLARRDVR